MVGLVVAAVLASCGGVTPRVTPTVAPTGTPISTQIALEPSRTSLPVPTVTSTPTTQPSATYRVIPTSTETVSATPITPTATLTLPPTTTSTPTASTTSRPINTLTIAPTNTATTTPLPTATNTLVPSQTPVPTVTPFFSATPLPTNTATITPLPSNTPLPTITPTVTNTPLPTSTPLPTFTPTLDGTQLVQILQTRQALEIPPTWTPVPIASATNTIAPTLDVTPTLITATPGAETIGIRQTPIPSTPQIATNAPTTTPLPTTAALPPSPEPTVFVSPIPPPASFVSGLSSFTIQAGTFNIGPGGFFNPNTGAPLAGGVVQFAQNPAFSESYARVDQGGNLSFVMPGGTGEGVIGSSPFVPEQYSADANTNGDRVTEIEWSPNGQLLAFVIMPLPFTDNTDTGTWVWFGDLAFAQSRDCPEDSYGSCGLAQEKVINNYYATNVEWRSDSTRLLINYNATRDGQPIRAIAVVPVDRRDNAIAPRLHFYDNGSYLPNGNILVSGRDPSGQWTVGFVTPNDQGQLENLQVLMDADQQGIWVESAVQRPDGTIIAFGKFGQPDGALQLGVIANGIWTPYGQLVGGAYPERIEWGGGNRQAIVTVQGQQFIVDAASGVVSVLQP